MESTQSALLNQIRILEQSICNFLNYYEVNVMLSEKKPIRVQWFWKLRSHRYEFFILLIE